MYFENNDPCVQVEAAEEADLVTASGLRFWSSTVREQNIRDVTHCDTILAYLQVGAFNLTLTSIYFNCHYLKFGS